MDDEIVSVPDAKYTKGEFEVQFFFLVIVFESLSDMFQQLCGLRQNLKKILI